MTVEHIVPKIVETFTGAGGYPFNFKVYTPRDVSVVVISEVGISKRLILDSDYTVEIDEGVVGGTVVVTYDEPEAIIAILRDLPYIQETVWRNGTPLDMPILESDFDKNVMLLQQMEVLVREGAVVSNWRGPWAENTAYYPKDLISIDGRNVYMSLAYHISGSDFEVDLAKGLWLLAVDVGEATIEAYNWARYPHGSPVPEGDGYEYSAYHWAIEATEGGVLRVESSDTDMILPEANTPDQRTTRLNIHSDVPFGIPKLDANGKILLDQIPVAGITGLGGIRGDDDCDKADDEPGDCVYPDYRNPSQRYPDHVFEGGSIFLILTEGNMFLRDTDQVEGVRPVRVGDGIIYIREGNEFLAEGWYLILGLSGDTGIAENVLFNDSSTGIKGANVQLWNEAADAAITDRIKREGDTILGDFDVVTSTPVFGIENTEIPDTSDGRRWEIRVENDGTYNVYARLGDGSYVLAMSINREAVTLAGGVSAVGHILAGAGVTSNDVINLESVSPELHFDGTDYAGVPGQEYKIEQVNDSLVIYRMDTGGAWVAEFTVQSSGVITFAKIPLSPLGDPSQNDQLTRKGYVDSTFLRLSGGTVTGATTFNQFPTKSGSTTPTAAGHFATKAYVDANSGGDEFPAMTHLSFYQASAPPGWTVNSTLNNHMLQSVAAGGGTSGGSHSPILMNVVPLHSHSATAATGDGNHQHAMTMSVSGAFGGNFAGSQGVDGTGYTGESGYHEHTITVNQNAGGNWFPKYINVVTCYKN